MNDLRQDFGELYAEHYPRLYAQAVERAGDLDAEAAVNETFELAWRRLPGAPSVPLPWLLELLAEVLGAMERAERRRSGAVAEAGRLGSDVARDPALEVVERHALLQSVKRLTATDREILLLRAWHGLSAEAAAERLGITKPAYFVRLHRARRRLLALVAAASAAALVAASLILIGSRAAVDPLPVVSPTVQEAPTTARLSAAQIREKKNSARKKTIAIDDPRFHLTWENARTRTRWRDHPMFSRAGDTNLLNGTGTLHKGDDKDSSLTVVVGDISGLDDLNGAANWPLVKGDLGGGIVLPSGEAAYMPRQKGTTYAIFVWFVQPGLAIEIESRRLSLHDMAEAALAIRLR
ncbi:sigma-70 family RNA polymerase sigma factor [Actinocorallia longicatena]|uniref:RNA polymerase sigma factor 70 region 4 type 2 domain-containing protein n=1 Tax=Actinocorallia longicatena TaxID=111803 RepID=A0ABP6QBQ5_9ACTN